MASRRFATRTGTVVHRFAPHWRRRDIRSAPDNPLAWYKLHSDDAATIGNAVRAGQLIAKHGESGNRFGVGLRLNYAPQTGLTIYGGAQLRF